MLDIYNLYKMFKFNELKSIHLEISNNCQASCPMCTRNIHGGMENPLLEIENWTLDRFKTAITPEVLNQIEKLYFCGNFGDPILNKDLPDMCLYAKEVNPKIQVRIHTNGSARSKAWWIKLASSLPEDHGVVFAIDGLEDTHSLYRIGTNYEAIIENAHHFILAGGKAEWAFIRFKHNEHQVEDARKKAKELGFETFTMKDSSRFLLDTKFPVWNKEGETIYHLEPSSYSELKFIDHKVIKNYKELVSKVEVDCYVKKEKEIYLDAKGHLLPCCWISSLPYISIDHEGIAVPVKTEMRSQYYDLVDSLGGLPKLDIEKNSLKDIIDSAEYQSVWNEYWNDKKLITCARVCGRTDVISNPNDQFVKRDSLLQ
jgi:MoaA/NifB/PqqE/SkfB family radical SAM enzyme